MVDVKFVDTFDHLENDHAFLLIGDVFTKEFLECG
jgi:hypothetical protein